MKKTLSKIIGLTLGLSMAIGVGVGVMNNREATMLGAENIACSMTGDVNVTLKVAADSTGDDVQSGKKMNKGSSGTITIPASAGSTTLYYYAVAWNGEAQSISLSCTNASLSKSSQSITDHSDVSGSKTTYVIGEFNSYACSVDIAQTSAKDMVLTLTAASSKRFVIFNAYYVSEGGAPSSSDSGSSSSELVPSTYSVTYNVNGATSGSKPTDKKNYLEGDTCTVLGNPTSLAKTGYIWYGWSLNQDGSGTTYGPAFTDSYTIGASNVTFYAVWIEEPSIPSYDEELAFHFLGSSVSNANIYAARSGTVDTGTESKIGSATWQITVGNSSAQLGTNGESGNLSKSTLGNGGFDAASGIASALGIETTTQKYSAAICTTPMNNVHEVELIFTGTNGGQITSAWVLSSINGTSWEVEARKVWGITTGSKFKFVINNDARQYAFVAYWNLTNSGGLKGFELKLYGDYPEEQTITASKESAYTDETVTLTTNAASAAWSITANTAGGTLSTNSAKSTVLSVTQAGSVTVQATADGYVTVSKTITFSVKPAEHFIDVDDDEISGYTGLNETVGFSYGNLIGSLSTSVSNDRVTSSIQNDDENGNAEVLITFVKDGSSEVYLKDGDDVLATIEVTITESTVTITGLAAEDAICVGETLDLGSTITVEETGSCSADVFWESEDNDIAEVSVNGLVTAKAVGTVDITVTALDYLDATMTCSLTISESLFVKVNNFQNGKKYIIAAQGSTNPNELYNLPAGTKEVAQNPAAVKIDTFADLTEACAWTATVDESSHIVFSNVVDEVTYYLTATNIAQGISVSLENNGYWVFDGTGLRYSDGGERYLGSYQDGSFRYYSSFGKDTEIVDVFYKYSPSGSAEEIIENTLDTHATLTYSNYTKDGNNYNFEGVKIKFGGAISKALWEDLSAESTIRSYGVMVSTADTEPSGYIGTSNFKAEYELALDIAEGDIDDAITLLCTGGKIKNFSKNVSSMPYLYETATSDKYDQDTYAWNLVQTVTSPEHLTRTYVAIAYVRTDKGIVFLSEARASVKSLASDMIESPEYNEDSFGGSLKYLAELA